ncbi:hypothetical protein L1987_37450 [Smallanthus sonchifolius]|uniref:Uncharacterized protein n=1 Tax=Smallanthus sonchifolius TaxID=185202 RepID=A0ACB9HH40_9ASTR|nr:hypothetical protein L1987_37450 [Smallanthus sonchifolius]
MAENDEEKTAFITDIGVFCYTKMPFGLKNARATYQTLMDKVFAPQIGKNLEIYVDDLVIKSHTEMDLLADIKETFKRLKESRIMLNPGKCSFGVEEGKFLDIMITKEGFRANPDKFSTITRTPSPSSLRDVQSLNGRLVAINRFLAKHAERYLPFVQTLKNCIGKEQFQWTDQAEDAFQQLKLYLAKLPTFTAPIAKEKLKVYIAAADVAAVSYSWSRGTKLEYKSRTAVKGQVIADFLAEIPEGRETKITCDPVIATIHDETPQWWCLYTDGASSVEGSGAGLMLLSIEGVEITYAIKLNFKSTNNKAEYEALLAGLRMAVTMKAQYIQAHVDSFLVANQVNNIYEAKECNVKHIPRSQNRKADALIKLASVQFAHLEKEIRVQALENHSVQVKEISHIVDNCWTWITPLVAYLKEDKNHTRNPSWVDEIPRVLWAHRTTPKTSNGETPFSLTYGHDAVIPVELGMPTMRITAAKNGDNDQELRMNLDLLEERRERAAILEAKYKQIMAKYYNKNVIPHQFCSGEYVFRSNEASRAEPGGKLGPNWEVPYQIKESLGKGAYTLIRIDGTDVPRTWNRAQLRKCYIQSLLPCFSFRNESKFARSLNEVLVGCQNQRCKHY